MPPHLEDEIRKDPVHNTPLVHSELAKLLEVARSAAGTGGRRGFSEPFRNVLNLCAFMRQRAADAAALGSTHIGQISSFSSMTTRPSETPPERKSCQPGTRRHMQKSKTIWKADRARARRTAVRSLTMKHCGLAGLISNGGW